MMCESLYSNGNKLDLFITDFNNGTENLKEIGREYNDSSNQLEYEGEY